MIDSMIAQPVFSLECIEKGKVRGLQMSFLLSDLEDAFNRPVDLLSTRALDPAFLDRIAGEEKLIYASAGS